jgi:hypothetical protein
LSKVGLSPAQSRPKERAEKRRPSDKTEGLLIYIYIYYNIYKRGEYNAIVADNDRLISGVFNFRRP